MLSEIIVVRKHVSCNSMCVVGMLHYKLAYDNKSKHFVVAFGWLEKKNGKWQTVVVATNCSHKINLMNPHTCPMATGLGSHTIKINEYGFCLCMWQRNAICVKSFAFPPRCRVKWVC